MTTVVPANVGIVANPPNKAAAEAFIEFLLSPTGQEVLLEPGIRRLPVNPAVYAKAGADYPNPFTDPRFQKMIGFDVDKSEARTAVVDTLFDQLISFQLDALKGVTKTLHEVDAALAKKPNPQAKALADEARALIAALPVTQIQASSPELRAAFTGGKEKGARVPSSKREWASFARENYAEGQGQGGRSAQGRQVRPSNRNVTPDPRQSRTGPGSNPALQAAPGFLAGPCGLRPG